MKKTLSALFAVGAFFALCLSASMPAQALFYNVTDCHVSGGCGTQTLFGIVDVEQQGANLWIDAGLQGGNKFVSTGDGLQSFDFSLTSTGKTLVIASSGFTQTAGTSFKNDGFGTSNYSIQCGTSRPGDCGTSLVFTILNATLADLVKSVGGTPVYFSEDIVIAENGNTGPVGSPGIAQTPIPGAAYLFGSAIFGIFALSRKRRRAQPELAAA